MTTKVTVSVNGNYKVQVIQGAVITWVSGRSPDGEYKGPVTKDFFPWDHGVETQIIIGPEKPDDGTIAGSK